MRENEPLAAEKKDIQILYARKGFKVLEGKFGLWHYETAEMKPCPNCDHMPIIEPCVYEKDDPPKKFIAVCDYCGLRTKGEHSPETCVKLWNAHAYTEASMLVCNRIADVRLSAGKEMVRSAVRLAMSDLASDVKKMWTLQEQMADADKADDPYRKAKDEYKKLFAEADKTQNFIETVCGTLASRFVNAVRKALYPEASKEQLSKMPTRLNRSPEWPEMETLLELKKNEEKERRYTMAEIKSRTQRPYTQYVNHMVRFFLSREESLELDERTTGADAVNWAAVQGVFRELTDEQKKAIRFIFAKDCDIVEQVRHWAELNALELDDVWTMLYRFSKKIAKVRGLI